MSKSGNRRDEILNELAALAKKAESQNELGIAAVLYAVCAQVSVNKELDLFDHIVPFIKSQSEYLRTMIRPKFEA